MTQIVWNISQDDIDRFVSESIYGNNAVVSEKLPSGGFHHSNVPGRQTVRHGMASTIEVGHRADTHDNVQHPYKNWGFDNYLEHTLMNASAWGDS